MRQERGARSRARTAATLGRAALVTVLVALLQVGGLAAPTWACACGGLEPLADGGPVVIDGETALVRHDGQTEDILLSFDMATDSESAALILPLPARAQLSLADTDTFEDLYERTRPEVVERTRWRGLGMPGFGMSGDGSGGAQVGSGVDVLEQRELGPFTVTQLTSDDAGAVTDWLGEHDYRVREPVVEATQPYLDEGWVIAAIQLSPGAEADGFDGGLQPVRASFPSEEMVYPMRMQAEAERSLPVRIYTLTEHRTVPALGDVEPELKFAGDISGDVTDGTTLAELTDGAGYLTRHDLTVRPEDATTDMTFAADSTDAPYREQVVHWQDAPWVLRLFIPSTGTFLAWAVIVPVLAVPTLLVVMLRRAWRAGQGPG